MNHYPCLLCWLCDQQRKLELKVVGGEVVQLCPRCGRLEALRHILIQLEASNLSAEGQRFVAALERLTREGQEILRAQTHAVVISLNAAPPEDEGEGQGEGQSEGSRAGSPGPRRRRRCSGKRRERSASG